MRYGKYFLRAYGQIGEVDYDFFRSLSERYNSDGLLLYLNDDGETAEVFLAYRNEPPKYNEAVILSEQMTEYSLPYVGFTVDEDLPLAVEIDDIILYDAEEDTFYHLQPTLTGYDGEFFVAVEWT